MYFTSIITLLQRELLQRQLHSFVQEITCYLPSYYMNSQQKNYMYDYIQLHIKLHE